MKIIVNYIEKIICHNNNIIKSELCYLLFVCKLGKSWESGQTVGKVDTRFGKWTHGLESGHTVWKMDTRFGKWTNSWESGQTVGKVDTQFGKWLCKGSDGPLQIG